ncbi:hypothetical protein JCGZ_18645 [Jatropha curcas]|uniref:Uncharacterized protein n=1 Tax=Jatropha curcas TaxID=180498 RepID=A0A067KBW5_JATCU|nr:uncharacterized protein LOC105641630 [Jatropha curcas]KDP29710.1 hypothetical protein JCGZ_18645 [Jatropha curcas]
MEELRKLEEVQRMLTFMQSHGIVSSSNNDSNRFLANLILLLINPCGDLDLNDKCSLTLEHLPKISTSFLDEASLLFNRKAPVQMEGYHESYAANISSPVSDRKDNKLRQKNFEDIAAVVLDAMQRANSTLEDFCRSYFMFHGMDINSPQSVFKYLPVLSFTEGYIYQMDSLNEKIVNLATNKVVLERVHEMQEGNENCMAKYMDVFKTDPFRPLVHRLECHGLLTDRIMEEFKCGEEYWALERKLCSALANQKEVSVEDVMKAIHLKSFDYRVLNLLLYQLRREKVNDLHMEFLSISEFLVEVSDDLFDYEDDVLENNFNILRMFVRIYGASKAPVRLAKCIAEAEEKYDSLLKTLEPQLSSSYQRRCEEATKEGGKISGHPLGTWNIPPLILDEELHRLKCLNSG